MIEHNTNIHVNCMVVSTLHGELYLKYSWPLHASIGYCAHADILSSSCVMSMITAVADAHALQNRPHLIYGRGGAHHMAGYSSL
jgi:hypothetical protein